MLQSKIVIVISNIEKFREMKTGVEFLGLRNHSLMKEFLFQNFNKLGIKEKEISKGQK
jgi:hypothetical protein